MGEIRNFLQGRFYCPTCKILATVIRDVDVTQVNCPVCGGVALPSSGDEP